MDDRENMWKSINALQVGQAATHQSVTDLIRSVDKLTETIQRDMEKGHEIHGAQAVAIAQVQKDVNTMGEKQREHVDSHRWWAGAVIGIVGLVVGLIEFITSFFKKAPAP